MKRKLGILALAVFFILTSAVTGTLANAAEIVTDESNTDTSGTKVTIENGIAERGTDLTTIFLNADTSENVKKFQSETLHVAVYKNDSVWTEDVPFTWNGADVMLWDSEEISNDQDRFVYVVNTGDIDAYVRTVFAFEADTTGFEDLLHINVNETAVQWEKIGRVTIEGRLFDLYVATYKTFVEKQKSSAPSLLQIAIDKAAGNAEIAQFGDEYEIKIFSQAVQVHSDFKDENENGTAADDALNKAFYTITTETHPWNPSVTN